MPNLKSIIRLLSIMSWLISSQLHSQKINLTHLSINQPNTNELAPVIHNNYIYFISNRKSHLFINIFNQENEHLYRAYRAPLLEGGQTGVATPFTSTPNYRLNIGSFTFLPNNRGIIATLNEEKNLREVRQQKGESQLGLYLISQNNKEWEEPEKLPLSIEGYSVAQPSLSNDGTTLYFVSNAPGGYGETDLYKSHRTHTGWSEPENLGNTINTQGRELFPFIHPSGTLYFSSNGHHYGNELNIYYSTLVNHQWTKPKALNHPINSTHDEFSCFIADDQLSGYFASNRNGADAIYYFDYEMIFCTEPERVVDDSFCFTFFEETTLESEEIALAYHWDLGDGTELIGSEVDHCYPGPGFYEITLSVIDKETNEKQYNVATYPLHLQQTRQLFFDAPESITTGTTLSLSAQLNGYRPSETPSFIWKIDDQSFRGTTIEYTFHQAGEYKIKCEGYWDGERTCSYRTIKVVEK